MQRWRDFLLCLMKTVRFSHRVVLFFFFSFPSSCPIPWRHAKSLPCFKNAVVSFHWASCGIVSTEIALILSEPCPIQPLYPAWFLVTTAPGQKFSVFLVCHLQSWQFVLSCVSVCMYVYTHMVWGSLLIPYWDGEHFGSLVYFSTGLFQCFLPFVSILLRKRGDLAKPELNSPLCTPIKRMQSIIWERKRTYSFGYRLHSVWGAGGREAET